jgi:hypothetical protein
MAYVGTTAASSLVNPPASIPVAVGGAFANSGSTVGTGGRIWLYNSTNSSTVMVGSNFFIDAYYIGMKQGDVVIYSGSTGSSAFVGIGILGAVTTSGAALTSTGGFVSSTANS